MENHATANANVPEATVQSILQALYVSGARPVEEFFSVADEGQGDVVLGRRRLFVTPNDAAYDTYTQVLDGAGLPYIHNDQILGSEAVVVGEIPRDARAIPQVMRGRPSDSGLTPIDVFYMVGRAISRTAQTGSVVPRPDGVTLSRILILRKRAEILFVPPVRFDTVTTASKEQLVGRMRDQLLPTYARFGAATLLHSFEKGLEL